MNSLLCVIIAVCCVILPHEVRGAFDCHHYCRTQCCGAYVQPSARCTDCFTQCCPDNFYKTANPMTSTNTPPVTPSTAAWNKWGAWSHCSTSCGAGTMHRSRMCYHGNHHVGNQNCLGHAMASFHCTTNGAHVCQHTQPVDGGWTGWSRWGPCSSTCGTAYRLKHRYCTNPRPQHGGVCHGNTTESELCNHLHACPAAEGGWGSWLAWSSCIGTCGTGTRARHRVCNNPPPQHGHFCQGRSLDRENCNHANACIVVDGGWGSWRTWSHCYGACGHGVRERFRMCNNPRPQHGGRSCQGDRVEKQNCSDISKCTAVDGGWTTWGAWGKCSATCGTAYRWRNRMCTHPRPQHGGVCHGNGTESELCNHLHACPAVHGGWGSWNAWSTCSGTCGTGRRSRYRLCNNPPPQHGHFCHGSHTDNQHCSHTNACIAVDGGWSGWGAWGRCSTTCGTAYRVRRRYCTHPRPQHGGVCHGNPTENEPCIPNNACPAVDGGWGAWHPWSRCSGTCGAGIKERLRYCNNPRPVQHGQFCSGSASERVQCNHTNACPAVDGGWTGWGTWGPCSSTCGSAYRVRHRTCTNPRPQNGGVCHGDGTGSEQCVHNKVCPAVNGAWGAWNPWSKCSGTCGAGTRERLRHCNNPPPAHHGHTCPGRASDRGHCNHTNACPAVDGGWGSWQAWSGCHGYCGNGVRKRHHLCNNPVPQYGGICHGQPQEKQPCNDTSICPVYHTCDKISVIHALAEINSTSVTTCHDNLTAHTEEFLTEHCKAPNDTSQWYRGPRVTHYCINHDNIHPYLAVGTFKHNQYGEHVTSGFAGVLVACNANNTGFKIATRICGGVSEVIELPLPVNFHHTSTGVIPDSPEEYYLIKWE